MRRLFSKDQAPSTAAQLAYMFPTGFLKKCVASTPDKRDLFSVCAQQKGWEEETLMERIATRLKVPYSREVPPLADSLDAGLVARFYTRGGIPVLLDGSVIGSFCIDPSKIQDLLPENARSNFTIVPWKAIKSAHDHFLARTTRASSKEIEVNSSAAFEYVIREAAYHQATAVTFFLDGKEGSYTFSTASSETGASSLSETHTRQLRAYLENQWGFGSIQSEFGLLSVTKQGPRSFHLTIPTRADETEAAPLSPYILFIEDNARFATIVKMLLDKAGFEVVHIGSPDLALSILAEKGNPCLIISDLSIHGSSHRETLSTLFSSNSLSSIPIIILSSEENIDIEIEAINLGAKVFLSKQRDPRILLAYAKQFTLAHGLIT